MKIKNIDTGNCWVGFFTLIKKDIPKLKSINKKINITCQLLDACLQNDYWDELIPVYMDALIQLHILKREHPNKEAAND